MLDEKKMIKKLKARDEETFKKIYYSYYKLVYYEAYQVLKNKEDAEDVMQNVFIKFMKNIEDIDDDVSIKPFLVRMSRNEAIDTYRRNAKKYALIDDEVINSIPDDNKSSFELISTLQGLLEKEESEIVIKRIVYDFTFKEISELLNESVNKIQGIYYRALEKLKNYYKGEK